MTTPIIQIEHLTNQFGSRLIHKDVNLSINAGEIVAIIGGSGSGKTTILKSLLLLLEPTAGHIKLFGENIQRLSTTKSKQIRRRYGVLFQHSALFSSMTVLENVMFPMKEFSHLPDGFIQKLAMLKLKLVGLTEDAANLYPAELSGGMQRRAAAARAIAMDPELLFLDEPTTGLDPRGARQFDELIRFLHKTLSLTIVMVTHDLETLKSVPTKIAFLGEGQVLACCPYEELIQHPHPLIQAYFK